MSEQPKPKMGGVDVIEDLCRWVEPAKRGALMARRALGIERYGQPLMSDDGRDTVRDLCEELLDAAAYAWSLYLQSGEDVAQWGALMRNLLEMVDVVDEAAGEHPGSSSKPTGVDLMPVDEQA